MSLAQSTVSDSFDKQSLIIPQSQDRVPIVLYSDSSESAIYSLSTPVPARPIHTGGEDTP